MKLEWYRWEKGNSAPLFQDERVHRVLYDEDHDTRWGLGCFKDVVLVQLNVRGPWFFYSNTPDPIKDRELLNIYGPMKLRHALALVKVAG